MLEIREEEPGDVNALDRVHRAAFRREAEGDLIRQLREDSQLAISLVATVSEHPVGHIAFSPVTPAGTGATPLALGPVGVDPEHERRGIASRLVQAGLDKAREMGTPWIAVLGDPQFYGRFGFEPASTLDLKGEFGDSEAFRVLILDDAGKPPAGSLIQYHPAFQSLD
ncbi:N-acetyltransferase [Gammaproteobacteria bacterium AB-CW1]|uniref:N-acetyltransferase n=1 Tax=Natronospira elongata TaxID=3110268 RepID=A0AAP6MLV8_9GAMM|nr:N-acetyltransferase [Gammaproteobacteria bacterium AB-CW1]